MTDDGHTVALDFFVVSEHWPCLTLMPRNYRIFNNLRKLKIALDVDRDVIDGDVGSKSAPTDSNCVAQSNVRDSFVR